MNILNLNTVITLRRDNDYNYEKVKNTFIPYNGEVILVDTARNGLRAKIGNGQLTYAQLPFSDEILVQNIIIRGYYINNNFYTDINGEFPVERSVNKIYLNVKTNELYLFDGEEFIPLTKTIGAATQTQAGIVKLYDSLGQNTDGTITQKAITDELNEKFELDVMAQEEMLIFAIDI